MLNKSSLSICRFRSLGDKPDVMAPEFRETIEKFSVENMIATVEMGGRAGWTGPQHFFDTDFELENIYHEPYLTLGLRVDKKKVPGALFRAMCLREEQAWRKEADAERVPPKKRREIREQCRAELLAEVNTSYAQVDWFWNVQTRLVGVGSFSKGALDIFVDLFERTFETELEPLNPYTQGCALLGTEDELGLLVACEPTDFSEGA